MLETKQWKETTKSNGSPVMVQARPFGVNSLEVFAWEPAEDCKGVCKHHTITYPKNKNKPWGRIGTRKLPAEIRKLAPGSLERCNAVDNFYQEQADEVFQIARKAYPDHNIQIRNYTIIMIKK